MGLIGKQQPRRDEREQVAISCKQCRRTDTKRLFPGLAEADVAAREWTCPECGGAEHQLVFVLTT